MDVMRPPLVWIGKRCYRKNLTQQSKSENFHDDVGITVNHDVEDVYADEICDSSSPVEQTKNGFRLLLNVPSVYFKFIIGNRGETKKKLENETRTHITVPKVGQEGHIVINGRDKEGVLSAKTRMDILVDSARKKQPFTHFISFPIAGVEFKEKLEQFKSDVLSSCSGERGIDPSIFQNPAKLHLTVGILTLMNNDEIQKATDVLYQCQQYIIECIIGNDPLIVHLKGLEYMNDDPSEVDVLYVKIQDDASNRLQMLADYILDNFVSSGLMKQQYDKVKLHVTVMNTKFRKDPSSADIILTQTARPTERDRESFNASKILKLYKDIDFGEYHVRSIHVSQRHGSESDVDGYYVCAASVTLP